MSSLFITVIFMGVAVIGAYLLSFVLAGKMPPQRVTMLHGLLAVSGIVVLGLTALVSHSFGMNVLFFAAVALGGLTVVYTKGNKNIALIHASFALIAIAYLIYVFYVL